MALTLSEAAKLSQDDLQRGVLETFVIESPVLDRIPFLTIQGNAYAYNEEATLPGVEFRAVNAGYSESTGTVNPKSEKLVILGGDADVDRFIVQTRGNLNDQRAIQTRMKVKAAAYKFQDHFINGDTAVDANGFDGLKKRLTGNQVFAADTNGMGPVAGGHAFFDALDELVSRVPGLNGSNGALYMNRKVIAKIWSSARRLGGAEMVKDALTGKTIHTYNGIPLLDIGQTAAGADIIPQTETQGTASGTTSSIYAVRFGSAEGDQAVTGLTNGGVQVRDLGELDTKPVYRTRLEFYTGLAVFGGKGAARMTGVLNA
ncbi:major head protein [Streptomyces phage Rowa]|uniref:Major capsid protein n=1 Tax=Streptomyces phage Rowa TaxID=2059883 RepID=A0A2H5BLW0_9CAUD|nr:major head protein [Streptomyces phage Rowa]AUG87271.1 major capsid protein [Streptomyces phage Rowa]